MSHYTVAVITDDPNKLSGLMEPYNEGTRVPRYIKYTAEQLQKEFEDFKVEIRTNAESEPVDSDQKRKHEYAKSTLEKTNNFGNDAWTTRDFTKWYHGYDEEELDEAGNAYSTYNPNSKWDWYVIGGRWNGLLILKNGSRSNQAKIKDVYFHGHSELPGNPVDDIRDGNPITQAIATETAQLERGWDEVVNGKSFYNPDYYIQKYGNMENYVSRNLAFSTYAVVTSDGKWNAPGDMGWFGCSTESIDDSNQFIDNYYDTFIKNVDPEHYIIIVDCHI